MSKKTLKKSLAGFMVVAVLSGTMAPAALIFAGDETRRGNDLVLEKLKSKRLEKAGQLKDFVGEEKMKTFSADESLKKTADVKQSEKQNYVEGEVLVKFKEREINLEKYSGRLEASRFANSKKLDKKEDIRKSNISVLKIKDSKTVEEKIAELKNDSRVEYVQPNFLYYPLSVHPNLWGLHNTGQTVNTVAGTLDADIDAPEAWEISEGAESEEAIIVAIIDTGVAYNHPDLQANMWDGNGCSGLDKNGVSIGGGCQHGYDYEDNDKIPLPTTSSHGTHIAGTIGAVKNDSGIIGVAPNVKIMALKTSLTTADNISSINFAEQNGAKVINASWGSKYGNNTCTGAWDSDKYLDKHLYDAINGFSGIFVAAAGNSSKNHDLTNYFNTPSDYGATTTCWDALDNIISVAATDSDDNLANFSDYGVDSVDVGAPGGSYSKNGVLHGKRLIYSTVADTEMLNETFESVVIPNVPDEWEKTGNWRTHDSSWVGWNKVLYGDYSNPYTNDVNSTITSPAFDLSGTNVTGATIDFWTKCDTEYSSTNWYDYMMLEISSDGNSFNEFNFVLGEGKFDEYTLDLLNSESPTSSIGNAEYHFKDISLPNEYLTDNFKLRFRWKTDYLINNYDGCLVDDIKITKFSDGSDEKYEFYNGTSMAAPHVAGLAALIWGYKSELSYSDVKNVILETGDDLTSLATRTVTGKRINAFNALSSLTSPVIIESSPIDDSIDVSILVEPYLQFSKELDSSTVIGKNNIRLRKYADSSANSTQVPATLSLENNNTKVVFNLDNDLDYYTKYYFYADYRVKDIDGNQIESGDRWLHGNRASHEFKTESEPTSPNTSPVMESITLDPNPAYTNTEITAVPEANDDDGDEIDFSYQWKKSIAVDSFEDIIGETDAILSSDNFVKGNIIKVIVTPNDGTDDGSPMESDPITISNTTPTQPTVSISPNPAYADNDLTCIPSDSTDADVNDNPVSYEHQWYKNGVAEEHSNTVLASHIIAGDTWKCEVVADDGENQSSIGWDSITILEEPDTTPPIIEEESSIATPTNNNTPDYTFISDEAGSITYYGSCGVGSNIQAIIGENVVTFGPLADEVYGDCEIIVTDDSNNASNTLNVSSFTIDTTDPTAEETTPVTTPISDTMPDVGIAVENGVNWQIKNGDDILQGGLGTGAEQIIILPGLGEETYNLTLTATDEAGNTITINLSEFTIDLSVSPISLSTLPNNPTNETTADIIVSGDDIVFYEYNLDSTGYGIEISIDTNIVLLGLSEGDHTIFVRGRDGVWNWSDEISETWTVDLTAPVIDLVGDNPIELFVGDTYVEYGATATDNVGITEDIEMDSSSVNTNTAGTYTVTYNVSDEAGNEATEITRTVIVSEAVLESIEITTPATKLIYTVGDELDISGLEITGTYNNDDTKIETITTDNVTGFNSSTVEDDQVLTITVDGKTTTYTVDIISASDSTSPIRDNGSPTGVLAAGTTETTLSLTTDENATCKYGTLASVSYDEMANTFSSTDSTAHSQTITGLTNGSSYNYYVRCQDDSANANTDDYTISFSVDSPPAGNSGGNSSGGNNNPPKSVSSHNKSLKMSSTQKGTLNQNLNNKNKVKVEIPKGSIKSTTTFTASKGSLEEGDVPKDKIGAFLFNGLAFNINAVDLGKKAVREFSEDLTITLTVPDLPDDTTGLELYYYDDEKEEWIIITDIEFGDGTITFKVNHLTQFAVFETNATKANSTSGTPEVKGVTITEILDGDIIQCKSSSNPFAVYIVKIVGDTKYIRHIVSLEIFNYYGHLKWENLKQVESLNSYSLSGWVRYNTGANYTATPTDKVYEINGDQTRHWINMTAEDFLTHGGSELAIFNINQGELNLYTTGADVMSL